MKRTMNDNEYENFRQFVKCRWLKCAHGMGLAGGGRCSANGRWDSPHCPDFITDDDYEMKNMDMRNVGR